ncbi:MAG: transcription termination/antitermination protein NusA [Candidatus Pelagibacter sp.]|nr:transcription termination/antitermination protein NusA [Candidatus Pelagibacter sp.]|tara:strand:- start:7634 stop:9178 length:1545 start_codon:yes stop_codon:yes gene_type:complete
MLNNRIDSTELIRIADAVAVEKSIDKDLVLSSMETAIEKAARTRYGSENDIYVMIDRETGVIELGRKLKVVEKVIENHSEISLVEAKQKNPDIQLGDEIKEELPPVDFGRIAAQTAKQVISVQIRDAERDRQFNEFKDKVGEILSGIVKRSEFGNVIVDLQKSEAIIRREELIPRENLKNGDRVKAYCYDVRRENKGPQIFLSRAHPQFLAKLFYQEVPEIYEGTISIKSVARDPGSRAKICVQSKDSSIDPVGACVGMRGSRVQTVVNELQGEKIDIINWTDDIGSLVISALAPAEVMKVLLDQENRKAEVVIDENNLSKAIGRRGQNVRLASKLLDHEIDILTDKEESEKRQNEFKENSSRLIKGLEIDTTMAQLLVSEGFNTIRDIHNANINDFLKIDGFDEETAKELQERAKEFLEEEEREIATKVQELGIDEDLANHKGLTLGMLLTLGEENIKTLKDFAELSTDEIIGGYDEIKGKREKFDGILEEFEIPRKDAEDLIMRARKKIFNF